MGHKEKEKNGGQECYTQINYDKTSNKCTIHSLQTKLNPYSPIYVALVNISTSASLCPATSQCLTCPVHLPTLHTSETQEQICNILKPNIEPSNSHVWFPKV